MAEITETIAGIPLTTLGESVADALRHYKLIGMNEVDFDVKTASNLVPTQEGEPFSAHSVSQVRHRGEVAAELNVYAVGTGEGIGNLTGQPVNLGSDEFGDVQTAILPGTPLATHVEAYLPIASALKNRPDLKPVRLAGKLLVLGMNGQEAVLRGYAGNSSALSPGMSSYAVDLLEKGFRPHNPTMPVLLAKPPNVHEAAAGARSDSRRALINRTPGWLQVFATLSLTKAQAYRYGAMQSILLLGADFPTFVDEQA